MFHMLKIYNSFLEKPVEEWKQYNACLKGEEIVNELRGCNDSAERGVKLVAEFLHRPKKKTIWRTLCKLPSKIERKNHEKRHLLNVYNW